ARRAGVAGEPAASGTRALPAARAGGHLAGSRAAQALPAAASRWERGRQLALLVGADGLRGGAHGCRTLRGGQRLERAAGVRATTGAAAHPRAGAARLIAALSAARTPPGRRGTRRRDRS